MGLGRSQVKGLLRNGINLLRNLATHCSASLKRLMDKSSKLCWFRKAAINNVTLGGNILPSPFETLHM